MPESFKAKVRNVGTSLGILIPNEIAKREKVKVGEEIEVTIFKKNMELIKEIEQAFGMAKGKLKFKRERRDRF